MSAVSEKPVFFQWQKAQGYPVFLRIGKDLLEGRLQKLIADLGFQEVPTSEHRKIPLDRMGTKVLTISRASMRVAQQVNLADSLDRYGHENLSYHSSAQVYLYRRIGLMVISPLTNLWELGLASQLQTTEELMGLRVMLNRYLGWALAPLGVMGFWGVATSEGLVAMKQSQSFGEVVFVDVAKHLLLSSSGTQALGAGFTILRADKTGQAGKRLGREELVSFLNTANIFFTHGSLPMSLRKTALELGSTARGEWSGQATSADGLSNA